MSDLNGFDPACNWPAMVASYRRMLKDEQRKVKFCLDALYTIRKEEGDRESDIEAIDSAIMYCDVMTPAERAQADEDSAALVAAEDEAVFSRRGV